MRKHYRVEFPIATLLLSWLNTTAAGNVPDYDAWSSWSPDGSQIAFHSDRAGDFDIYVMDADGSNVVQLTDNLGDDLYPSWSPSGPQVAFQSVLDGDFEICVIGADGSNLVQLTDNSGDDGYPRWSPDGSQIGFHSDRDGDYEIYVMEADGSNVIQLTDDPAVDQRPGWGSGASSGKIALQSDRDGDFEIYVMDTDGSRIVQLTENLAMELGPSWSPDGSQIAFHSDRDDWHIYVMDADGSNVVQLTDDPPNSGSSWSPDGSRIAFHSHRDGDWDIYVMDPDGSNVVQLTHDSARQVFGVWQWPTSHLPVLDGDISEWEVVPDNLWITINDGFQATDYDPGRAIDLDNLSFRVAFAWNDDLNRLYMVQERFDDVWDRDAGPSSDDHDVIRDDSIEIGMDADHSGGMFWHDYDNLETGRHAESAHYYWPPREPWGWKWIWTSTAVSGPDHWFQKQPHTCCADSYALQGGQGVESILRSEWYTVAWDGLDHNSLENSVPHDFAEGEIIGLAVSFIDSDPGREADLAKWVLGGQQEVWGNASVFSDFILLPVDEALLANTPELAMPVLEGGPGDIVTVAVSLDLASLVAGGDVAIGYDPDILTFREVRNGDLTPGGEFVVVSNTSTPGQIVLSIAGARAIGQESGTFLELDFEAGAYRVGQANTSELRFDQGTLASEEGTSIPARRVNGSFTLDPGIRADVNQDGSVTSADAILILRFAVGLIALDEVQQVLADVNGDGRVNAGDAVLALRKAVGLIHKPVAAWPTPKLAWGTPASVAEGAVTIPLLFEGDIHGGDFLVRYEGATWEPTGLRAAGQNAVWAMRSEAPGALRFTVASTEPLERLELLLEGASGTPSLSLEEALVVDGGGRPVAAEMPSVAAQVSALPGRFALLQNYPNPFNPQTHITYHLARREAVTLQLYALTGQSIRTLVRGTVSAGTHTVVWDGRDKAGELVSSGVYLVRLAAGDFVDTRRMMLLR